MNGIVILHTYIPKDSVQILMGRPISTTVEKDLNGINTQTMEYQGTNSFIAGFTIEFINGELSSVRLFQDHYYISAI